MPLPLPLCNASHTLPSLPIPTATTTLMPSELFGNARYWKQSEPQMNVCWMSKINESESSSWSPCEPALALQCIRHTVISYPPKAEGKWCNCHPLKSTGSHRILQCVFKPFQHLALLISAKSEGGDPHRLLHPFPHAPLSHPPSTLRPQAKPNGTSVKKSHPSWRVTLSFSCLPSEPLLLIYYGMKPICWWQSAYTSACPFVSLCHTQTPWGQQWYLIHTLHKIRSLKKKSQANECIPTAWNSDFSFQKVGNWKLWKSLMETPKA